MTVDVRIEAAAQALFELEWDYPWAETSIQTQTWYRANARTVLIAAHRANESLSKPASFDWIKELV